MASNAVPLTSTVAGTDPIYKSTQRRSHTSFLLPVEVRFTDSVQMFALYLQNGSGSESVFGTLSFVPGRVFNSQLYTEVLSVILVHKVH